MLIKYYPYILAILFSIMFVALGINPVDREVWIVEVTPIVITFLILVSTFKIFRFSNSSYTLMVLWMFLHTIGGHYTFANVPFDFVTELFGFERNNFDRMAHFIIGFYAFPMAELVVRKRWAGPILASFFGLFFVISIAAGYEIIEWFTGRCLGCTKRRISRYFRCHLFIGSVLVYTARSCEREELSL